MILGRRLFNLVHFTPHTQEAVKRFFYIWVVNWLLGFIMENSERPSTTAVLIITVTIRRSIFVPILAKNHNIKSQKVTPHWIIFCSIREVAINIDHKRPVHWMTAGVQRKPPFLETTLWLEMEALRAPWLHYSFTIYLHSMLKCSVL